MSTKNITFFFPADGGKGGDVSGVTENIKWVENFLPSS